MRLQSCPARHLGAPRSLAIALLATIGIVSPGAQLRAAQYYVATNGSDASNGSTVSPWRTLQHAADAVGPGDRVVVRPGSNYTGFYLDTSGTAAQPIEFFAEPGVTITQENGTTPDGINLEGASHIIIDGFNVVGMDRAGVRSVGFPSDFAEFVTVRNVTATNNGVWGIFTGHVDDLLIQNNFTSGSIDEHGIYVSNSGDRPILRGNASWNNHGSGIHMNGDESQGGDGVISGALISGNRIYNNAIKNSVGMLGGGSGINMDGVQNSRIENNLVYGNHASGISLYQIDAAAGASGNVIVNNTIHQASDGRWALNIQDGAINNTVLNNVLVTDHSFRGALDISEDSLPGLVSDYNAVVSRFTTDDGDSILTLAAWRLQTGDDAHSMVAPTPAAMFVSPATGDYHPKPGSPIVNAGTTTQAPTVDFFGNPRLPGAVDIGAVEFAAGLSADFNHDGTVSGLDLTAWGRALGEGTGADADGDFDSDGTDFLSWQRQRGLPASVASFAAVPEPGAFYLLAAAAAASLRRGVKKKGGVSPVAAAVPEPTSRRLGGTSCHRAA